MSNPSMLLPLKFGRFFEIHRLLWKDFPGEVEQKLPWSAHIYWNIEYKITDYQKKKISVCLNISKKSWAKQEKKCDHLLNHEQGHYLIASLCVLEFMKRIDYKKKKSSEKFEDLVAQTFDRTIKQFLDLEIRYDKQTQHRLNYKAQQEWDQFIYDKLVFYAKIYDQKKNRFVKYSESPNKDK